MKKLKEIFNVTYWTKLDFNKMEICEDDFSEWINFVSRTSQNNWVVAKIKKITDKNPLNKWQITVSLWGSYVLSAFLQLKEFYTAQNVAVLKPIDNLSERELLYYCMCIAKNRFRYWAFWREANSTLKELLLPSKEQIPNFVYTSNFLDYSDLWDPIANKNLKLSTKSMWYFKINDMFILEYGQRWLWNKRDLESWNCPIVSSWSINNWIYWFYSVSPKYKHVFSIARTWTIWEVFFHDYKCCIDENCIVLTPKFNSNKYLNIFFVGLIRREKFRYIYWRQVTPNRLGETKIKLPIDLEWNPDWKFMEDYIKSLPYSKYL